MSKMREAFEKWAIREGYHTLKKHDNGKYKDNTVALLWYGYQAAIAAVREGDSIWDQQFCARMYKLPED